MTKILTPMLLAASLLAGGLYREDQEGEAGDTGSGGTAPAAEKGRIIEMDDGRKVNFGEKTKMKKDYGVKDDNVFTRIDFDNGKVIELVLFAGNLVALSVSEDPEVAKQAKMALDLMGHGSVQKQGDAASGATSTEDAYEAVLAITGRLARGEFNKVREGGGESAKGASELVIALTKYLNQSREEVRAILDGLNAADKAALRRVPEVAEIIVAMRAEKEPTAKEAERLTAAKALLDAARRPAPAEGAPAA